MKSILLYVNEDSGFEARLQAALDLARATGGHLSCLHVTPLKAYISYEGFGGVFVMEDAMRKVDESVVRTRETLVKRLENEDVTWSFHQSDADPAYALASFGCLADVIVLSRPNERTPAYVPITLFGDLLFESSTPLIILPEEARQMDVSKPVVVAWNDSIEAANALRQAVPLLKLASAVHIVTVEEDKKRDLPPLDAAEYLSRHGIHAEVHRKSGSTKAIDDLLVSSAQDLGAGLIAIGAYGHSRARQYLLGGVTRSLLSNCPVGLFVAR